MRVRAHDGLYDDLMDDFGRMRKEKKRDEADYAVVNVSPSVVPNPLLPSFRVFSYNVTGAEHLDADAALKKHKKKKRKGGRQWQKEQKPDLRKRTWDVVETGLGTLDYDGMEDTQAATTNTAKRRQISYDD